MKGELSKRPNQSVATVQEARSRVDRLAEAVTLLAEAFRQKITPITIAAFERGTMDLEIRQIELAVDRAIIECRFMPSVFELRELAGVVTGVLNVSERSLVAWSAIKRAVPQVGAYRGVTFDCAIINATLRAMGGWSRFCDCEAGAQFDTWLRKEFEANYAAFLKLGVDANQTLPLPGLCDKSNSAAGYSDRVEVATIRTGLPPAPARLIHGTAPAAIRATETKRIAQTVARTFDIPTEPETKSKPVVTRQETTARKDEQRRRLAERGGIHQSGKAPG